MAWEHQSFLTLSHSHSHCVDHLVWRPLKEATTPTEENRISREENLLSALSRLVLTRVVGLRLDRPT